MLARCRPRHAGYIRADEDRRKVMGQHLARAGVVLVSADLLANGECGDDDDDALRRSLEGKLTITD